MALSASMKSYDVAVVGEIYADHIFSGFSAWPQPGEEVQAETYARELGGGAVNTACGLARLGRKTRLVGLIGESDLPWLTKRLGEFGLGSDGLHIDAGGTGITVSVSMPDDRSFFTHVGANRKLAELLFQPGFVDELGAARHVHFAMPLTREQARFLLPKLKAQGCSTSLDVGFSPAWLDDKNNVATCREVDYFLPNQKEAALLTGSEATEVFAAWARSLTLTHGVVKLGAAGAFSIDAGGAYRVPPPAVVALDTTGAGDAFDAGFIDGLLDGESIEICLRRACVCGALCATMIGALAGLPTVNLLRNTYERTYGP